MAVLAHRVRPQVKADYAFTVQRHGFTPAWREKMVGWFEGVQVAFKLERCTVAAATDYLDRFLSKKSCTPLNFQLASVGCLFLAAKVEEQRPLTTADLCQLTEGVFTREDVRLMELELLCVLKWRLHPPAAETLVGLIVELYGGAAAEQVGVSALAYARQARRDLAFVGQGAVVAGAAVLAALREHDAPRLEAERWAARLARVGLFGPRPLEALGACCLRLLSTVAPHVPRGSRCELTPTMTRGLDAVDAEVAAMRLIQQDKALLLRTISPADVTADVYQPVQDAARA